MDLKTHWLKIAAIIGWLIPIAVNAHGFGEKYDLPVPMSWIIWASCAVVLLSFLLTPFIKRPARLISLEETDRYTKETNANTSLPDTFIENMLMVLSISLFVLTCICSIWGSGDALMNFAPTFIWIVWWLGTSFAVLFIGDFWSKLDPWKWSFLLVQTLLQKAHFVQFQPRFSWPTWLAFWPAAITLCTWCSLEIIYPLASMPEQLGIYIGLYSLYTWLGMGIFGLKTWRLYGDGFSVYFKLLNRCRTSSIQIFTNLFLRKVQNSPTQQEVSPPQNNHWSYQLSLTALVVMLLTSVLFDGIHASPAWLQYEHLIRSVPLFQNDINGYRVGFAGLVLLWMSLLLIFLITCHVMRKMLPAHTTMLDISHNFALSLLPIAAAYLMAHNFSSFFLQGQNIFALLSDPFGKGWDLFGTAHFYPDITLIDAKLTWYVATISIVTGHVISVLWADNIAMNYVESNPWFLNLPMTLVMIAFTALSLSIIAEPLTIPNRV